MSIEEVADELYGLPPEEFTAARAVAAKADKPNAKQISPSASRPSARGSSTSSSAQSPTSWTSCSP